MDSLADRAIELIRKHGTMRDNQLAARLGCNELQVALALSPLCETGELVRCSVKLVGKGEVNEYRVSAAGPRKADDSHLRKRPTPPEQVLAAAAAATVRTTHRSVPAAHRTAPTQPRKGENTMTDVARILAAFEKHGPMTVKEAREHADVAWIGVACPQLARRGKLVRLGGGPKSSIYGLPGQKLPKGNAEAVAIAPTKPTKRKARKTIKLPLPVRRGPGLRTARADLRMPNADAGAFRAAIAS
ncbi:MAG: hypothetical protein EPO20_22685, partial [Betaproteobacteria bacterium]